MTGVGVFDNRKRVTYAGDRRDAVGQTVGPSTLGELWTVDEAAYDEAAGVTVLTFRPARGTDRVPAAHQAAAHAVAVHAWARAVADRLAEVAR